MGRTNRECKTKQESLHSLVEGSNRGETNKSLWGLISKVWVPWGGSFLGVHPSTLRQQGRLKLGL